MSSQDLALVRFENHLFQRRSFVMCTASYFNDFSLYLLLHLDSDRIYLKQSLCLQLKPFYMTENFDITAGLTIFYDDSFVYQRIVEFSFWMTTCSFQKGENF